MSKLSIIPVIDLFAGPGGLGEGFSTVTHYDNRVFDIKLSIEMDENAHKTLELRSFYRQFKKGNAPEEYYVVLRETNLVMREKLKQELFEKYPVQYSKAHNEAWLAELGSKQTPSHEVDERISSSLNGRKDWLLIGGPPCQAYSLAGRSRVGGINSEDKRVYLYQEYLRIISAHHPAVFVMENVKGLLSAKIEDEKVFDWMLRDLHDPASVFKNSDSPKYKIYSLVTKPDSISSEGLPEYTKDRDYLIQAEKYNIPQKRHRVILLGIREDVDVVPGILKLGKSEVNCLDVLSDLPIIRSGLNKSFLKSEVIEGKKKRHYRNEVDNNENWVKKIDQFKHQIAPWLSLENDEYMQNTVAPSNETGSEFVKCISPAKENPLYEWYRDWTLQGVCNHQSRSHLSEDLMRYLFASIYSQIHGRFPRLKDYGKFSSILLPDHANVKSGKFVDRFRVQLPNQPATTITSHISKDGHYYIHYDPAQCRSLTVREAARLQTFPDNYLFCGSRTTQFHQVGNAVPPYLANQIGQIVKNIFEQI
jgi:DNA (cytosine-5)-methyltransferase 1